MIVDQILAYLQPYFTNFGYLLVFFGVFLENSAMLGLLIPGETILLMASFYAAQGHLNLGWVIFIAFLGCVLGDNLGYYIGKQGGRRFLLAYGKYVFITRKRIRAVDRYFKAHGGKTIFIARFTSFLRALASITAGSSKMPYREFFLYDFLGAILWSVVISVLGYFLGGNWQLLMKVIKRTGYSAFAIIIVIVIAAHFIRRRRVYKKVEAIEDKNN